MAAPTIPSDDTGTGGSLAVKPNPPVSFTKKEWMDVASFIFTGVAAIGLLIVLFGVFLTPNDLVTLIGALIVTLAAIGWLATAIALLVSIIKLWLTSAGKVSAAGPPTRPE